MKDQGQPGSVPQPWLLPWFLSLFERQSRGEKKWKEREREREKGEKKMKILDFSPAGLSPKRPQQLAGSGRSQCPVCHVDDRDLRIFISPCCLPGCIHQQETGSQAEVGVKSKYSEKSQEALKPRVSQHPPFPWYSSSAGLMCGLGYTTA